MIFDHDSGGKVETRAVQRTDDTLIIYLSSTAGGCSQACRMCWLVQTGQTKETALPITDYLEQATEIFTLLDEEDRLSNISTVHWNFMAQGDALMNPHFIIEIHRLYGMLNAIGVLYINDDVNNQFKISTIFPKDSILFKREELGRSWINNEMLSLSDGFEFYYSLYSLKDAFRKKWLPKALDPEIVGKIFYGKYNGLRLHHCLIEGLNDTEEDVALIHQWLERHNLHVKINIVRYNPFSDHLGRESSFDTIQTYVNQMNLSHRVELVQIIPRIGEDVKASCGTFITA
jgi:adenine C2-methylase RlmN of 23S rRNA A2503 and tRNA A37